MRYINDFDNGMNCYGKCLKQNQKFAEMIDVKKKKKISSSP